MALESADLSIRIVECRGKMGRAQKWAGLTLNGNLHS